MVFKGGSALKRCYELDYRFSEDLDFTLLEPLSMEHIREGMNPIFEEVKQASGISFSIVRPEPDAGNNTHTFYLGYEGPIRRAEKLPEIKVDVTIRERVVFGVDRRPILRYEEYSDLPADDSVQVYSLEEISVEKIMALTAQARTEPRDLYDLFHLTQGFGVRLADLRAALDEKLRFKERTPLVGNELETKEDRLRRGWEPRLGNQVVVLPEFESVFRTVQRELRQAQLYARDERRR